MQDAYKSLRPSQLALPLSLSVVSRALSIKSLDNSQLLFWLHPCNSRSRRPRAVCGELQSVARELWLYRVVHTSTASGVYTSRLLCLVVWFSLRVREAPGSTPCKWSEVWLMIEETTCTVWRIAKCCKRTLAVLDCAYAECRIMWWCCGVDYTLGVGRQQLEARELQVSRTESGAGTPILFFCNVIYM